MVDAAGGVAACLRARRQEIAEAIFARVREVGSDTATGMADAEYLEGLRGAVAAAVDYALAGMELADETSMPIPGDVIAQARRAARGGVSLDAVLRRYIVGHALLSEYVMQEADELELAGRVGGLREVLRAQASLLDRLVAAVSREYAIELRRAGRSREDRLQDRVRMLLAGEHVSERELGYALEAEHLAVIGRGDGVLRLLRNLSIGLDRRLLSVAVGDGTTWAWLGGQRALRMADLERLLSGRPVGQDASLAFGEPARGPEGWRSSHQQAQAALMVALRRPRLLTRYADVALLAAALKDEVLANTLSDIYISPLGEARDGGAVLRETLRAYLDAGRNASSAAVALKVARSTVVGRLRRIEDRLGHALTSCAAELEVALDLDELSLGG